MKYKYLLILLIIVVVASFALAGCGAGENDTPEATDPAVESESDPAVESETDTPEVEEPADNEETPTKSSWTDILRSLRTSTRTMRSK